MRSEEDLNHEILEIHEKKDCAIMKLGLLVNFGHYPGVEIKRIVV